MDKLFLYKDWLESFRREVANEMERMRKAPVGPPAALVKPAEEATAALRSWWDKFYEDPIERTQELAALEGNKELEFSRKEVGALHAELQRLRSEKDETLPSQHERLRVVIAEKARLEEQLSQAMREIAGLKEYREIKSALDQELGGLRMRMSAIRGEYEGRIKHLQEETQGHERRAAAFTAELNNERERRLAAEKTAEEHRSRLAEAEALRSELQAVRGEVETRLSTAAEFLEAKIRGVQDQSKGQALQLRELVEALRRLRDS